GSLRTSADMGFHLLWHRLPGVVRDTVPVPERSRTPPRPVAAPLRSIGLPDDASVRSTFDLPHHQRRNLIPLFSEDRRCGTWGKLPRLDDLPSRPKKGSHWSPESLSSK